MARPREGPNDFHLDISGDAQSYTQCNGRFNLGFCWPNLDSCHKSLVAVDQALAVRSAMIVSDEVQASSSRFACLYTVESTAKLCRRIISRFN